MANSGIHGLGYERASIDALDVPAERPGLRTLFNAFHHLRPEQARAVLASAVEEFAILPQPFPGLASIGIPRAS